MSPEQIVDVLASKEGSPCRFVQAVEVTERFKGTVVWQGTVFVFALKRPPDELCYAWIDPDAKSLVTVLKRPPVESPETAVRAYIASRR
jgi:hypothetical protein